MLKIFIILIITAGLLFSQTKSDSVDFNNLHHSSSTQYKKPTFLRVTGQALLGTVFGLCGLTSGSMHVSLAPIGWMFCSSFGVNLVGGTKGSSFWWTFAGSAVATVPATIGAICADDPISGGMVAFLGVITSITAEILFYWASKDYGEEETNVEESQRKIDLNTFQNYTRTFNLTQPDISVPIFQFNF